MAEGELHGDLLLVVPAVTHEHALVVVFLPPFLAFFLNAGILALGLEGAVCKGLGQGERQPAGRVDSSRKHVCEGVAGL